MPILIALVCSEQRIAFYFVCFCCDILGIFSRLKNCPLWSPPYSSILLKETIIDLVGPSATRFWNHINIRCQTKKKMWKKRAHEQKAREISGIWFVDLKCWGIESATCCTTQFQGLDSVFRLMLLRYTRGQSTTLKHALKGYISFPREGAQKWAIILCGNFQTHHIDVRSVPVRTLRRLTPPKILWRVCGRIQSIRVDTWLTLWTIVF